MKIIKYTKKNKNQYTILLSDKTSLSFYDDTIIHYNLLTKKDLTKNFLEEITEYNKNYEAYYKALKDLSVKLRTEKELVMKLQKSDFSNKNISFAITKLKNQGYINDDLYLTSYINDQVNLTLKGPKKIKNELIKLGFKEEVIDTKLLDIKNDEWTLKINKYINKKVKSNHSDSLIMLKQKIRRDLLNLGYDSVLIDDNINAFEFSFDEKIIEKEIEKAKKKYSRKYKDQELINKIKYSLYKKGFENDLISKYITKL